MPGPLPSPPKLRWSTPSAEYIRISRLPPSATAMPPSERRSAETEPLSASEPESSSPMIASGSAARRQCLVGRSEADEAASELHEAAPKRKISVT